MEMLDQVAQDAYFMHRIGLMHEMAQLVTVFEKTKCLEILSDGVRAEGPDGAARMIEADTVLYALGMKANRDEAEALRAAVEAAGAAVYEIGDCVSPAKVYDAVRQGFVAAWSIV